jgi:hypothetical protein
MDGPYPAAVASLTRLGGQAATVAAAITSAAEHLLDLYALRQADGSVRLCAKALGRLDPHLLAEMCVVLWRREGWPQRDMTADRYAAIARLIQDDEVRRASTLAAGMFPGGVTIERLEGLGMLVIARR